MKKYLPVGLALGITFIHITFSGFWSHYLYGVGFVYFLVLMRRERMSPDQSLIIAFIYLSIAIILLLSGSENRADRASIWFYGLLVVAVIRYVRRFK